MSSEHAQTTQPSEWVCRWVSRIAPAGRVLDLACGPGRHARLLAGLGYRVCAVDRDPAALALLAGVAGIETLQADLEGQDWPYRGQRFAGIVVANYLYRPLLATLIEAVEPGGVLIYETFGSGNEQFGRPSNPDFLLRPGELLDAVRGALRVIAYEDREVDTPKRAMIQRICAERERLVA